MPSSNLHAGSQLLAPSANAQQMDVDHINAELRAAQVKLSDLKRAFDRGVHRNELIVAAQQTIDRLGRLRGEAREFEVRLGRLLDRYERLMVRLLN